MTSTKAQIEAAAKRMRKLFYAQSDGTALWRAKGWGAIARWHLTALAKAKGSEKRLRKALKLALLIIRNDASAREHCSPQAAATRERWCDELEVESGLKKKPSKK